MKQLKLSDSELAEMKDFYLQELEQAQNRLNHIKAVLKRIGAGDPQPGTEEGENKARKKPGRKSQWEQIVMKRLRQLDRPVTYEELTEEIMMASKIPESKRESTKQAIINVVFRLRNRDEKLDTFSMGKREKYIALNSWFTKQGTIRKEYASRVVLPG